MVSMKKQKHIIAETGSDVRILQGKALIYVRGGESTGEDSTIEANEERTRGTVGP